MNGCGAYVYVEVKDGKIIIQQDIIGSYGIYFYQNDDYFALSNSFFRLLDHIKTKGLLSLNRDYANYMFIEDLSSLSCRETPVNEINIIGKNAIITIDAEEKTVVFDSVDYKEDSASIDSAEGIAILDAWFLHWTMFFRNLRKHTDQINVSLSGGFDSRVTFLLMLKSGVNLNEISVNSIKDTLHTHVEDYEIASEIAEYFGFRLNAINALEDSGGIGLNADGSSKEPAIYYSLEDIINIEFYTKMAFHKEMLFRHHKSEAKKYFVSGVGGESVREHFDGTAQEFIDVYCKKTARYPRNIANEISNSVAGVINSVYGTIRERYCLEDDGSKKYPYYLWRDARANIHFGRWAVEDYCYNTYTLSPLLDPKFRRLKLSVPECPDNNLLITVIYARYCPELLNFRFDKGRSIKQETVEFARKLNEKFPVEEGLLRPDMEEENRVFHVNTKDASVSEYLKEHQKNKNIQAGVPEKYLKSVFDSMGFRKLFATCFDEEIYEFAKSSFEKNRYFPMRECYAILGITKVIEDIIVSHGCRSSSIMQSMDRFICENHYEPDEEAKMESNENAQIIMRLKDYITGRLDFKLFGVENPELEVVSVSDKKAKISKPGWLQKDGMGYMVESYKGVLDISFQSATGGNFMCWLRGRDVRDKEGKRIPYWIDYKKVYYNDNLVLEGNKSAWHDKPLRLEEPVKAGEVIRLHVEWMPHRCDKADMDMKEV